MSDRRGGSGRSGSNDNVKEARVDYGPVRTVKVLRSQSKSPKKRSASSDSARKSKHRRTTFVAELVSNMPPIHEAEDNEHNDENDGTAAPPDFRQAASNRLNHPSLQDSVYAYGEGDREYRRTKLWVKGSGGVSDQVANAGNVSSKIKMFEQKTRHERSGERRHRTQHQNRRVVLDDSTDEVVNTYNATTHHHSPVRRDKLSGHTINHHQALSRQRNRSTMEHRTNLPPQRNQKHTRATPITKVGCYSSTNMPETDHGHSHRTADSSRRRQEQGRQFEPNNLTPTEADDSGSDSQSLDIDDDGFDTVITPSVPILPPPSTSIRKDKPNPRTESIDEAGVGKGEPTSIEYAHVQIDRPHEISSASQSTEFKEGRTKQEIRSTKRARVTKQKSGVEKNIGQNNVQKSSRSRKKKNGRDGGSCAVYVVLGVIVLASALVIVPVNVYQSRHARASGDHSTVSRIPSMAPSLSLYPSLSPSISMQPSRAPSFMPSVSQEPSTSAIPSASPSLSPSISLMPSASPSVSSEPSYAPNVSFITGIDGVSAARPHFWSIAFTLVTILIAFSAHTMF